MTDDTARTRFLGAIAAQLPAHRVVEVHLFGAIRQGGVESGVAVVAVDPDEPVATETALDEPAVAGDGTAHDGNESSPYAVDDDAPDPEAAESGEPRAVARRFTVYTARYRHTLKGLDRGKWEASVTEEADAPLLTVDAVVRGVSRRSGEADETVRLSGDEFRAALPVTAPVAPGRPQSAVARGG